MCAGRSRGAAIPLVSRSGSWMRKSFALCEAFGLTPFPSPWIPPFQDAARSAREGLSAGTGRPGRRHSRQWRRGPPLPALRCAQRGASAATGGCARVRGGGGGRPRPLGMLPWRGREAARRDHQPQLVRELMTRDTRAAIHRGLANPSDVLVVRMGRSALNTQFLGRACKGGRPKPQEDGHERRHDCSTCLRDGTLGVW